MISCNAEENTNKGKVIGTLHDTESGRVRYMVSREREERPSTGRRERAQPQLSSYRVKPVDIQSEGQSQEKMQMNLIGPEAAQQGGCQTHMKAYGAMGSHSLLFPGLAVPANCTHPPSQVCFSSLLVQGATALR